MIACPVDPLEVLLPFSWIVYTPLEPREALMVEDRVREGVAALVAARPGLVRKGEEWGDITVEEAVPSGDDVAELSDAYGRDVSDEVLDRLDACRSALSIERNGVRELDPLQVSILRYVLDQVPGSLVDWGDMQIVLAEDVLLELDEFDSAGAIGASRGPAEADNVTMLGSEPPGAEVEAEAGAGAEAVPEAAPAGLERASETERAMETVLSDPFLQRRFRRALDRFPDFVRGYVEMLEGKGAMSDAAAAQALGVSMQALDSELGKLHDMTVDLADEADEEDED